MEIKTSHIYRNIGIVFAIAAMTALGYFASKKGIGPEQFSGNIIVGLGNPDLDPLLSGRACFSGTSTILRVADLDGGAFDWYVTPPANVLSEAGGQPMPELLGVGTEIIFNPPREDDVNADIHYFVEAVPAGTLPGAGGGEVTEINIGPPCVTGLAFVNPSGVVFPEDGEIQLNTIRAALSSGETVNYDASQIGQLGLRFVATNPDGTPATGVQIIGNRILVPTEHPEIEVRMELSGNALEPVVFDTNNRVAWDDISEPDYYFLESDEVDPDSVSVFGIPAAGEPIPGPLATEGTDYVFHDEPHDADPATNDYVEWIGGAPRPSVLYISYWYRPLDAPSPPSTALTIAALQCELLEATIYEGRGQGFSVPEVGVIPSEGSQSITFDFGTDVPFDSIEIFNPSATGVTPGSRVFRLEFTFDETLSERAVIASQSGSTYEITVQSGGDDFAVTAENFAYAVNILLGAASPFIAYISRSDIVDENDRVVLYSLEIGAHTNNYLCMVNEESLPACFTGGVTGGPDEDGDGEPDSEIVPQASPPRSLDPVMAQGETRVIYSRGGISNLTWRSTDASIFSVVPLSEASASETLLGNEHVILNVTSTDPSNFTLPMAGSPLATPSDCVSETLEDGTQDLQTCVITLQVEVTFTPAPGGYSITMNPPDADPIPGIVQGNQVSMTLTGSATINHSTGGAIPVTGQASLPVGGDAIGSLNLSVTMRVSISPFELPADINSHWTLNAPNGIFSGFNLIPTDRTPNAGGVAVTNFAVLTAKRPGTATLSVTDALGCVAPLQIQVQGERLYIDFEDPAQGEFIEQGDSIELHAWTGFRGGVGEENDVTNSDSIEWLTDNSSVVTVSPTGRVLAVAPGVANVTARYDTEITETGTVTSEGHLRIHVNELHGLTISLDRESLSRLTPEQRESAYQSVAVLVNDPAAAGRSIQLEDRTIQLALPVSTVAYANELERIGAITQDLVTKINTAFTRDWDNNPATPSTNSIQVTAHPTLPGVIVLEPADDDADGVITVATTAAPEQLLLLPSFTGGLDLPTTETYRMIVVAEYDNGRTRVLPATSVTWVVTPVNRLNDSALVTGLLQKGDVGGASNVFARFTNPDGTVITSNSLAVRVPEGPVIEFVRPLGSAAIVKGNRLDLLVRVSDIDSVEDIQEITASLVRTQATTYAGINADTTATWFTVETFLDEAEAEPPAAGSDPASAPAPAAPQFRNFTLPVQIPVDAALFDGQYRFLISISDQAGHTAHFILPVFIGPVAQGDVNADGRLNMIDVILAFQIANGRITPTTQQLQAANLDGFGNVGMIDVLLLFQRVTSGT